MSQFFSAGLFGSAIPDSEANQKLHNRWYLDDVGTGTTTDSVGSADGTVNGVSATSGDWVGGSAGDGDGTDDYISTTSLGNFDNNLPGTWAIGFSIQTTASSGAVLFNDEGSFERWGVKLDGSGGFYVYIENGSGQRQRIQTDNAYNDGNPHRVVARASGTSASDIDVWVDQSSVSISVVESDSVSGYSLTQDVPIFANNNAGSIQEYLNAVLDDVCIFDDAPTDSEIQSYNNPWS